MKYIGEEGIERVLEMIEATRKRVEKMWVTRRRALAKDRPTARRKPLERGSANGYSVDG
jgi:hypothetical protein